MTPHVLIAEDREDVREALFKAFTKKGCKVSTVQSGKDAFEIVKTGTVDLVVSDIRMPDGTGIELLRWMRRLKKTLPHLPPVIITTALLDRGESYLRKLGACDIFLKPFIIADVVKTGLNRVEEALRKSQE